MAETRVNICLKYLIFFLNFFFWLMGCGMICIGAWAYINKNPFSVNSGDNKGAFDYIFDAAVVMVAVGTIVFVLAFAGCIGALRENTCLLKFFYVSLILVFLLEMVAAILAFVFSSSVKSVLATVMREEALTRYFDDIDLKNMIDFFQKEIGCCGISEDGYKDWNLNPYYKCEDNSTAAQKCSVPFSCCRNPVKPETQVIDTMCGYGTLAMTPYVARERIYTTGCMEVALSLATMNLHILGAIAIIVALSQIATIFMARTLEDQINEQKTAVEFDF